MTWPCPWHVSYVWETWWEDIWTDNQTDRSVYRRRGQTCDEKDRQLEQTEGKGRKKETLPLSFPTASCTVGVERWSETERQRQTEPETHTKTQNTHRDRKRHRKRMGVLKQEKHQYETKNTENHKIIADLLVWFICGHLI